ncbi:MAG: hypothetical protein R3E98_00555 [Gemmatimonadota bacterium]|nr:hypothetical protein [Gemmatimonadota bacterium]
MRMRVVVGMVAFLLAGAAPAAAQVSRADSAAVLLESARTFEARERWEVAEALYQLLIERFGDTPAGAEARAHMVSVPVERRSPGRVELTVWSTLYGLWLGGAIPWVADADGPEAYGVGLLLGGPAGFLAGRSLARSRPLSSGQARAITFGGTWGSWQGAGWALAADLGIDEICDESGQFCFEEDGDREAVTAAIVGGLAGIGIGTVLSRRPISDGLATTVNFGALWGTWFGFATSYLVDLENDALLAGTLIGGDAGLVATALLGRNWNLSRNRARLISIAGVMGGLGGAGLDLLIQPDDDKVALLLPLLGSVAGLGIGAATTRNGPDRGGPEPDAMASAFLRWQDGALDLGAPLPMPVRVQLPDAPGERTAWRISWLSARF